MKSWFCFGKKHSSLSAYTKQEREGATQNKQIVSSGSSRASRRMGEWGALNLFVCLILIIINALLITILFLLFLFFFYVLLVLLLLFVV